jgi:methylmalonyl-CoA mutase
MNADQPLFGEFAPATQADWEAQARADLKGADFDQALVWQTASGLRLQPLYGPEALAGVSPGLAAVRHQPFLPEEAFLGARRWQYCEHIPAAQGEAAANAAALEALNLGAEAVCFDLAGRTAPPDWAALCAGIQWPYCAVAVALPDGRQGWLAGLERLWEAQGIAEEHRRGFLWGASNPGMAWPRPLSFGHPAGLPVHEKLGELLLSLNRAIDAAQGGRPAQDVLRSGVFHYELDSQYFFQIAGLRALRLLAGHLVQAYGEAPPDYGADISVHAITRVSDNPAQEQEWNMLSNTTQAMSAILGGCQYLSIRPHDALSGPTPFSKRIARNVSNLLRDETYLDKVADPAAGSYYLEHLTQALGEQAWAYFQSKAQ